MNKLLQLEREALNSCIFREHDMGVFRWTGKVSRVSKCKRCGMEVEVNAKPLPNQIDIGGEAVALTCARVA